ncbi:hypothetical protein AB0I51_05635 [Streptomyces sp. NPDC050549]|uniref:hypothetical protein n=1 Tax=Streptomyces sp. NPDC050549 TaxID=3155406 RepID=UPI00341B7EBD
MPRQRDEQAKAEVVPYEVAMHRAAEIWLQAALVREWLPSGYAARRAFTPGGPSLEELEAKILATRGERNVLSAKYMYKRGLPKPKVSGRTAVLLDIDRAAALILWEREQAHSKTESRQRSASGDRWPETGYMTPREIAREGWQPGLGVESVDALEEMIWAEVRTRLLDRQRP